ncbi:formylmethanofuran dehydrogenase subunit B [Methanoculleus sp. FWC-SCC1]|uniref:Formylmethanofuran dehydrogenase subunit B n=1 Tax=Methanoculleus frigidifontis TaxID=2584085 RepID=A0ABT8M8C9_9EURY|nr:formylmethanofuran dehydrogenase subunit B [Methanoculleus sp. FWC-SCC1]MDN7024192.1 formylmethanofuran dehydrogenase subunit B [Methanoculleus sp. FWC-SCC1]
MQALITSGRTIRQGEQLYYKDLPEYSRETGRCFINPVDLLELCAEEGANLRIATETGAEVFVATSSDDVVPGTAFIPCGPHANAILHADTHGTGAPDYKWMVGTVTRTEAPPRSGWEILIEAGGTACPEASPHPGGQDRTGTVRDVLCPLCGCLCDDVAVRIVDNAVVSADNACSLGSGKFLSQSRIYEPIVRDGEGWRRTGFDDAVRRAAEILRSAERPLLFGWSGTSAEAQCLGIHIAEEIRGVIDNCSSICHGPSIIGIQESGHPGSTLGQMKNRADVVIYWGSNPIESHPRHMSRYTTFCNGKYRTNGHQDRTLVVVDIRKTDTAKIADEFIRIKPGGDYAVFSALRAIVRGQADIIPPSVAGIPKEKLLWLADLCKKAKFGALFTGIGLTQSPGKYKNVRCAIQLVDELNRHTKFTLTPMRGHWNVNGTNQTFSYLTGFPYGVDFSRGIPYYNPGETTAVDMLSKKEADACLIIGADPGAHLPRRCVEHLAAIPTIVIDPYISLSTALAEIHIPVACVGIETEGIGYRMDSVPLRMKKVIDADLPTDEQVLSGMLSYIRGAGAEAISRAAAPRCAPPSTGTARLA